MVTVRHLSALVTLLATAAGAMAQANDADWVSYRDAYRATVVFEKYGKAKHLIQNHLQVIARERGVASEGLQLTLRSKSVSLNVPLDPTGRAALPLLKSAYDDNGALYLNRKVSQYTFRQRVSIVLQPDGVYELADLRSACEQALAYARHLDNALRARRCSAVRFVYAQGAVEPGVRVRKGEAATLPVTSGPAFEGDAFAGFRVVDYRFGGSGDKGQIVTPNAPLAITPVYE